MSEEELTSKLMGLAQRVINGRQAEEIIEGFRSLEVVENVKEITNLFKCWQTCNGTLDPLATGLEII